MEQTRPVSPETDATAVEPPPQVWQRDRNVALACAALLLIGMPIGYLPGSTGDKIGLVALCVVSLAVMAAIVFWLVPRERMARPDHADRTAIILGIVSLLLVLVFWTGLPFAVGAGAVALGLDLRESAPQEDRGHSTVAVLLGALAVLVSFIVLLVG